MEKVTCYKCNGTGAMHEHVCGILCNRNQDYTHELCKDCTHKNNMALYKLNCNVCHGNGTVDWIDNLFRKDTWKKK